MGKDMKVVISGENPGTYAEDYHITETIMLEDYLRMHIGATPLHSPSFPQTLSDTPTRS